MIFCDQILMGKFLTMILFTKSHEEIFIIHGQIQVRQELQNRTFALQWFSLELQNRTFALQMFTLIINPGDIIIAIMELLF